jgi:antitoxin (DNA-binding transcriptional repressor) of toxin-antitoxin stability system
LLLCVVVFKKVGEMGPDETFRIVTAEEFASRCCALLDDVEQNGHAILITRDGAAVARLIPATESLRPSVGRSRGTIEAEVEDLIAPAGEDWEGDRYL